MKKLVFAFLLFFTGTLHATVYYSNSSVIQGDPYYGIVFWNDEDVWNTAPDGSGTNYTASGSESGNDFIVQSEDIVYLNGSITFSSLLVNSGAFLVNNNISNSIFGNLTVAGSYNHDIPGGGTIPTATWLTNSDCNINNANFTVTGLNQNFSNLIWNNSSQSLNINLGAPALTVSGTFTVLSCGTNRNINFNGATLNINNLTLFANLVLNSSTVNLTGNLLRNSGNLSRASGTTVINFMGPPTGQAFAFQGTPTFLSGTMIINVNSGSVVDLSISVNNLILLANQTMSVSGVLSLGTKTITASLTGSNVSMGNGSTLSTNNPGGVSSSILATSGSRYFDNNASYIIGGGSLGLVNTTIRNLTINNTQVAATSNLSITGSLILNNSFDPATYNIFLGGNVTGASNIIYGTGSSTFIFNGNTTFSGTGNRDFNNVSITGNVVLPPTTLLSSVRIRGNITTSGNVDPNFSLVQLIGNTPRTVIGASFYDLDASGTGNNPDVTYFNTVNISGTWLPSTGVRTMNGTFNFNGTGAQVVNGVNYNHLQISGGGTKSLTSTGTITGNLIVSSGSTFNISANTLLGIAGNIFNSGSLVPGTSTVNLNGASSQSIIGSNLFYNLIVSKASGGDVVISTSGTNVSVSGLLNLAAFNTGNRFYTNNNLTLLSTATNTASLIDASNTQANTLTGTSGSLVGNVRVQRYSAGISAIAGHFYSSPIANAPFSVVSQPGFNTLLYSENNVPARVNPTFSGSFRRVTTAGSPAFMTPGRGFSSVQPTTTTLNFNGIPNNGDVPVAISYSTDVPASVSGWNLIGNPYPSAIDWGSVTKPTGVSIAYVYQSNQYVPLAPLANTYIGSGQGFFIRTTSSSETTITFKNADRIPYVATANTNFYRQESPMKYLYLDLISKIPGNNVSDAVIFSFSPEASDDLDAFDATKLYSGNPYPNIYTIENNTSLALNVMSDGSYNKTVPLEVYVRANGEYTLSARNLPDFYSNVDVYLIDTANVNSPINLRNVDAYSFEYTTTASGRRFSIAFAEKGVVPITTTPGATTFPGLSLDESMLKTFMIDEETVEETVAGVNTTLGIDVPNVDSAENIKIFGYKNKLYISGMDSQSEVNVYDTFGNRLLLHGSYTAGKWSYDIQHNGIYIVKLFGGGRLKTKKVIILGD